jgi:flagellar biosynthesis/type III secretory pathway chaperone
VDRADKDVSVLAHIQRLVAEEHQLLEQRDAAPDNTQRLADLQVQLDQCWDLLRQRRALRETGADPSAAQVRPPDVVERYIG